MIPNFEYNILIIKISLKERYTIDNFTLKFGYYLKNIFIIFYVILRERCLLIFLLDVFVL